MSMHSHYLLENPAAEYFEESLTALFATNPLSEDRARGGIERLNRSLRRSTLYSAMAAEAYVNSFLTIGVSRDQFWALDRQPTINKYLLAPQLAAKLSPFSRNGGPLQSLITLFKQRNEIVHGRPQRVELTKYGLRGDPEECARWIVAVAESVRILNDCLEDTPFMGPLETMHDLGDEVDIDHDMLDVERTYFFTGGLVHVVGARAQELYSAAKAMRTNPLVATPLDVVDLLSEGHRLEAVLLA